MIRSAQAFIAAAGWGDAEVRPLAGDASNRRYDRLTRPDGTTAVLMDADPARGENVGPFLSIAAFLSRLGLSAPRILHRNEAEGFLLIEDLGDRLFAREMAADPSMETPLYRAAAEVLSVLHDATPPKLRAYDAARNVPLAALAYDWYLFGATGVENALARGRFCAKFAPLSTSLDHRLDVLIQRDFHAENLLWLPEREGPARVGLLDFQDAMRGHRAYDLVSILQDARRDVTPEVAQGIKDDFVADNGLDADSFETAYAILGLQRNLRILGVFARLCLRDGKAHYVDLIPRVWGHVKTNLAHPRLRALEHLLEADLPAPSPEVLSRLRQQVGQWAGR